MSNAKNTSPQSVTVEGMTGPMPARLVVSPNISFRHPLHAEQLIDEMVARIIRHNQENALLPIDFENKTYVDRFHSVQPIPEHFETRIRSYILTKCALADKRCDAAEAHDLAEFFFLSVFRFELGGHPTSLRYKKAAALTANFLDAIDEIIDPIIESNKYLLKLDFKKEMLAHTYGM